jgi:two-component system OmpR family sensor kinase
VRLRIRTRIALLTAALIALVLAAGGLWLYVQLRDDLLDAVDSGLEIRADDLVRNAEPRTDVAGEGTFDEPEETFAQLLAADGTVLASSPGIGERPLVSSDSLRHIEEGRFFQTIFRSEEEPVEVRLLAVPDAGGHVIVVGVSLEDQNDTLADLAALLLGGGPPVLVLVGGIGWLIARAALQPMERMREEAAIISASEPGRRLPVPQSSDEVARLGQTLNAMLTRLEDALERERRFVADASHELRTPLTSIRGFAELYRQGAAPDPSDVARLMRRIEDESARMGLLVEDLLLLARLDQQRQLERHPVDLLTLAVDAVHDARVVAPARAVDLDVVGTDHAPMVTGDEPRLRQVVGNLVGNALTHTPPRSPVTVRVGTMSYDGADWALLEVADAGSGLAPEDVERVFERFYRADASRTRAHGGAGLGLSIVAALVAAHGGAVDVESQAGRGASFRVRLPLREPLLPAPASPSSQPTDSLAEGMSQRGRQL